MPPAAPLADTHTHRLPPAARRPGAVFNIQGYAIHDGPGIRTTVFLKGCPLRCAWCQNPESQHRRPELFFNAERCVGCGACAAACEAQAIRIVGGKAQTERALCNATGHCVTACVHEARSVVGQALPVEQVFREVCADQMFFRHSGGGVTLSGGEPLAQPAFAAALLRRCREAGIHTALDTCGHAPWPTVQQVLAHVDLVLYDFKHMDAQAHRRLTGVSNALILRNAERIHHELKRPMQARVPIIPGHNDSAQNLQATARFIAERLSPDIPVHLNAYHRMGAAKHDRLERPGPRFDAPVPGATRLHEIQRTFEAFGLRTHIGG